MQKAGFKFDSDLKLDYSYINKKERTRINKQSMQKSKIDCKAVSQHTFCLSQKIYRIYDCGKKRWIYNKGEQ